MKSTYFIKNVFQFKIFIRKFSLNSNSMKDLLDNMNDKSLQHKSIGEILLADMLFRVCSLKSVVGLISSYAHIQPIKALIKYSAFKHFCGGESSLVCIDKIQKLYQDTQITSILDHSVEENECSSAWDDNMNRKIELLNLSKNYKEIKYIPIKLTSLVCSKMLEQLTEILNNNEKSPVVHLNDLHQDYLDSGIDRLCKICNVAVSTDIGLLLDAEQSYRQPAVEYIYKILSQKFNAIGKPPVVYNTYQMYLKRSTAALKSDYEHSLDNNYVFAAKIVRGAYMSSENYRSQQLVYETPILNSKELVDKSYFNGISYLMDQINTKKINSPMIIIATHNKESILQALDKMQQRSIPKECPNIQFAQILGMCDHLTSSLSLLGYNSSKLICFGEFEEILPWLVRRFQENQVMITIY